MALKFLYTFSRLQFLYIDRLLLLQKGFQYCINFITYLFPSFKMGLCDLDLNLEILQSTKKEIKAINNRNSKKVSYFQLEHEFTFKTFLRICQVCVRKKQLISRLDLTSSKKSIFLPQVCLTLCIQGISNEITLLSCIPDIYHFLTSLTHKVIIQKTRKEPFLWNRI